MLPARLRRLLTMAHLILWWERLYALLAPVASIVLIWGALSLLGVWQTVPPWGHALSLAILGALAGLWFTLAQRTLSRLPRETPSRRIELDSALPPGYFRDLSDQPVQAQDELWHRHLKELRKSAQDARLLAPKALIDKTDPYTIRAGALLFMFVGVIIAGNDSFSRLKGGAFPAFGSQIIVTADVWIDPPPYTNKPPVFLLRKEPLVSGQRETIIIPEGSVLSAQLTRPDGKDVRLTSRLANSSGTTRLSPQFAPGRASVETPLTENAALELRSAGHTIIWPLSIVPDIPPTIEWEEEISVTGGTRLSLPVFVSDDYGIETASLELTLAPNMRRPPDAPPPDPETLTTAQTLDLPALRGRSGRRLTEIDLTENKWAGLPVSIRFKIADGAGNEAITDSQSITLPVRAFYNPLARSVLEQRQSLALAPSNWQRSARTFDALTFAPEFFARSGREYLLVRSAYHQVFERAAEEPEQVVDSLWPLALSLEDESLMRARERLEAAKKALREALARGAPQAEIDVLIEELRLAMNEYLAALARSDDAPMASGDAEMEGRDLQDILDEIAELRRMGDTEEARRRLEELERLLENIQFTNGSSSGEGQGRAMNGDGSPGDEPGDGGSLGAATNIIQRQRELADDTFSVQRGDRFGADLSQRQQELADDVSGLTATEETGQFPSEVLDALTEAELAMRAAQAALDGGELGLANDFQEQAIEALRRSGRQMAESQREDGGTSTDENRPSTTPQQTNAGGAGESRDPLGRGYQITNGVGSEYLNASDPERIRALTEKLREQLADPTLSDEQREYLERLLRRF